MYEARSAEYILIYLSIYLSIEFRSFFDLKYTKQVHVLQELIDKIPGSQCG